MSDKVKVSTPWSQQGGGDDEKPSAAGLGDTSNLLQVPCPHCGQALALGREYLGGHCLCSVCDELMLVSLKKSYGGEMAVVAEKVDKMTGEKISDSAAMSAPEVGGPAMEEDWENTRPVKMWAASTKDKSAVEDDDMDLGATMPIPTVGKMDDDDMDLGATMPIPTMGKMADDEMDLGVTMPVPTVGKSDTDHRGLGATMPIPAVAKGPTPAEVDEDWEMTTPGKAQSMAPRTPSSSPGGLWGKEATGRQGVKLAPPGEKSGKVGPKAPAPTSGAVPTVTTPPTKAPAPTTGSVPTLDSGQVSARQEARKEELPAWQPPGLSEPLGKGAAAPAEKVEEEKAAKKKEAVVKKKSNPFGNKASEPVANKKVKIRRRAKSRKGLVFVMFVFLLVMAALAVFIVAPGLIPRGLEAREFVDGRIDEARGQVEGFLAQRALSGDSSSGDAGAGVRQEEAGGAVFPPLEGDAVKGEVEAANMTPVHTRESDAALQKLLSQEGEQVIRRFYGASSVDEKLAFVVDAEGARSDMEQYFSDESKLTTVRSVLFRGGARDSETGHYYGVFDVTENENDASHRWCVVDPGTGLYQVDWILYRQIVASRLGEFLRKPAGEGAQSFHMLLKLGDRVPADDSPWFDDAVRVEMQVPMISSSWYSVLVKKPLADSLGITTKLANGRLTMAVVEIAWVAGDKESTERLPAIVGVKQWGAWARNNF